MYDVVIIGAGVSGSAVARSLSRYQLSVCVLEKEEDVCSGTSKANSAIVHAGFDAENGSLMAKLNVEGNKMMDDLAKDLDIPFERNGSLVVCVNEADRGNLEKLYQRGINNGVEGLRIVERDELVEMEPNISDNAVCALYAPTGGIICPFELNLAMAEHAKINGVDFKFNTKVEDIEKKDNFIIHTNIGDIESKYVVNAAGVYADIIHNLVSSDKMTITPRKGEYYILDKGAGNHVSKTIFALPSIMGKGILVTPTIHGNLMLGPTATDIDNKEGTNTTRDGLKDVTTGAFLTVKDVPVRLAITNFSGLRAHEEHHEFIIKELEEVPGFIECSAIESPGLTSSPAIGEMVCKIITDQIQPELNKDYIPTRKGFTHVEDMSFEERAQLIKEKPEFGTIICRCESVSEGEILEAIHRPLPAHSLDGVKRRVRAGMGRCQAGFCSPKVMEILAREVDDITMENVTKSGGQSTYIVGYNKEIG